MKTKGTVWVLGASSGLGLATAEAFARDGWLVVAGARSFAGRGQEQEEPLQTHRIGLDVLSEESCEAFARQALQISPRVDALCYAAGLLVLGPCEETSPAEYQRVMETNFIGMTRMVGKALPIMRGQGGGKLILFSSLNGLVATPFQSAYTASKHAIEGYAQCLAMETRPFGVRVCVVQPGDHRGGSQTYRLSSGQTGATGPYAPECRAACAAIRRDESGGLSPQALGREVVRNANRSKMHYTCRVARLDQRAAVWLRALLWPGLFFAVLRLYYVGKPGNATKNRGN